MISAGQGSGRGARSKNGPYSTSPKPKVPKRPSNWFGRLRSMSAAASAAVAGFVALNASVSQSRTESGAFAACAAKNSEAPKL
jgi:hypothetical protein